MNCSTEQILLLAKSRQVEELKNIAINTIFVEMIGFIVHQLQAERGASCLYIASSGLRFDEERAEIIAANESLATKFDYQLTQYLQHHIEANAKQLTLISWSLLGFRQLESLRQQVDAFGITFLSCMQAYTRLINSLISLLFEIIDNAASSKISKLLASLYNLVLAKESAGQERAIGAYLIGSGKYDEVNQQRFIELIESQDRHFELFTKLTDSPLGNPLQQYHGSELEKKHSQFRSAITKASLDHPLNPQNSDIWFALCTERLDLIWDIQCKQVSRIREQLNMLVETAKVELEHVRDVISNTAITTQTGFFDLSLPIDRGFLFLGESSDGSFPSKSITHLLQCQSDQIAEIESELAETKKALSERKVIERAKGLLMTKLSVDEVEAYKWMRKTAMDQNRKLIDVAENIISLHRA
jgi:hypothetical protein